MANNMPLNEGGLIAVYEGDVAEVLRRCCQRKMVAQPKVCGGPPGDDGDIEPGNLNYIGDHKYELKWIANFSIDPGLG